MSLDAGRRRREAGDDRALERDRVRDAVGQHVALVLGRAQRGERGAASRPLSGALGLEQRAQREQQVGERLGGLGALAARGRSAAAPRPARRRAASAARRARRSARSSSSWSAAIVSGAPARAGEPPCRSTSCHGAVVQARPADRARARRAPASYRRSARTRRRRRCRRGVGLERVAEASGPRATFGSSSTRAEPRGVARRVGHARRPRRARCPSASGDLGRGEPQAGQADDERRDRRRARATTTASSSLVGARSKRSCGELERRRVRRRARSRNTRSVASARSRGVARARAARRARAGRRRGRRAARAPARRARTSRAGRGGRGARG